MFMNDNPLVSVIIPTYNRGHLLKRSIDSVLKQTYSNIELIVVDDGSTDNTRDIVHSINDERVVYLVQPNSGACSARNKGILSSKGEFVAFQDSDDEWMLNKIEKQIECIKKTGADVLLCRMRRFFSNGREDIIPTIKEGWNTNGSSLMGASTQTFFGKKECFVSCLFDEKLSRLQDFDLIMRLSLRYRIFVMEDVLVKWYYQDDSISSGVMKVFNSAEIINNKKELKNKFLVHSLDSLSYLLLSTIIFQECKIENINKWCNIARELSCSLRTKVMVFLIKYHISFFYKIFVYLIK